MNTTNMFSKEQNKSITEYNYKVFVYKSFETPDEIIVKYILHICPYKDAPVLEEIKRITYDGAELLYNIILSAKDDRRAEELARCITFDLLNEGNGVITKEAVEQLMDDPSQLRTYLTASRLE